MASDHVLDAFVAVLEAGYADNNAVEVARLENHQNPQDVIKSNSASRNSIWILVRNQPARLFKTRLSRQAPVDELGTIDVDVIVSSHGQNQAQIAHDILGEIAGDDGLLWGQIDQGDLIEVREIVRGPSGDRLGGSFFGLMVSVSYEMAGGGS